MGKLKAGTRVKLTGSVWSELGWSGRIVTVLDRQTKIADGAFEVPTNRGLKAGHLYFLQGGESPWGYELVDGVERTYSTDEIVSAIRSLTEAGVHRELAVKVVSDRVQAGGEL